MSHGGVVATFTIFLVCLLFSVPLPSLHPSDFLGNLFCFTCLCLFLAVLKIIIIILHVFSKLERKALAICNTSIVAVTHTISVLLML